MTVALCNPCDGEGDGLGDSLGTSLSLGTGSELSLGDSEGVDPVVGGVLGGDVTGVPRPGSTKTMKPMTSRATTSAPPTTATTALFEVFMITSGVSVLAADHRKARPHESTAV
jgi:hypothetical protein